MNTKRLLQFVIWHAGLALYFPILFAIVSITSPYVPATLTPASIALVGVFVLIGCAGIMGTVMMDAENMTIMEALREAFPPQQEAKGDDPKQADWR